MKLTFYGAAREVTGSCTLIETDRTRVLVDCGLIQGSPLAHDRNLEPFPFDPRSIDALIVTHAHIDHIGRIPKLVKEGFLGRIFCTHPTRLLSKLMWQDAAHVMKDDARRFKKPPIFLPKDIAPAFDQMHGVEYDTEARVAEDVTFRFREAGHIFGSAFVEMTAGGVRLVFSGDVGNDYVPILKPTESISRGDIIVMESTYGDRKHDPPDQRVARLRQALLDTVERKGTLMIPAFSLERTQEILYELNGLVENGQVPRVPFYLDSPLAVKCIPIYKDFPQYYDQEATALKASGDDFFQFPGLHVTKKAEDSESIAAVPPPKVIIAGSGMMHGGRIMRHLVQYLSDDRNTVLIIGYQAMGTLGRAVMEGADKVVVDHQEVPVKARVEIIGAYSAHADQDKLMRWVTSGPGEPKHVYLNHGDFPAATVLAEKLQKEKLLDVTVPEFGETFEY